jgi:hypothetical protein
MGLSPMLFMLVIDVLHDSLLKQVIKMLCSRRSVHGACVGSGCNVLMHPGHVHLTPIQAEQEVQAINRGGSSSS